jgi:hypothetical protein
MKIALIALALALPAASHAACRLHAPDADRAGKGCARAWIDANLKLNDIQTVGTHNSYKQFISPKLYAMVLKASPRAVEIDYGHPTLTEELNDGARGLEIDVAYDPKGPPPRPQDVGRTRAGGARGDHDAARLQGAAHPGHRLPHLVLDLQAVPDGDPHVVESAPRPHADLDHHERQGWQVARARRDTVAGL